ncbi:hypothetical protein [Actinoplanes sp. NPDC051859]|uniref:hypothetical protein n=1 Tax=Actinoplanes sp. NPDC051859 TaxID=3363909 RepID=UPI0037A787D6
MGVLNWFVEVLLRVAARRWPADVRDDMSREWAAELLMLRQRRGTAGRRLSYAFSLAATPLTFDENGEPRSRWERLRPGPVWRSIGRLMAVCVFGVGASMVLSEVISDAVDPDYYSPASRLLSAVLVAMIMTVYTVAGGRWAGSGGGHAPGPAGSLGVAATAVGALSLVLWPLLLFRSGYLDMGGMTMMAASWIVATFVLVVAVVRAVSAGRTVRAWVVAAFAAPVISMLPMLVQVLRDPPSADNDYVITEALGDATLLLLPWTVCAVAFGWAVARRWREPAVEVATPTPATPTPATPTPATATSPASPVRWSRVTAERLLLGSLAAVSAVAWTLSMTVLQPLSEPEHLPDATAENNTYWARELRWDSLIALILVLLVYVRGDRRGTRAVLLGGGVWFVADLGVDRLNLSSGSVPLAIGAVVAALAWCAFAGTIPLVPRPGTLFTGALIAAVLAGVATMTESPYDTEPELNPSSAGVGALLAVVAVVAAVRAAGTVTRLRVAVAVPVAVVAGAVPVLIRFTWQQPSGDRFLAILTFTVALAFAVVVLSGPRPRGLRGWLYYPAALTVTAIAIPVVWAPLAWVSIVLPVSSLFTALAGNPPVHGADTDVVYALLAVPVAVVLGRLLRRLPPDRPLRDARQAGSTRPEPRRSRPILNPPDPA